MDESKKIISHLALRVREFLSGKFCFNCFHHEREHIDNKCYGLNFNGIWSACRCLNYRIDITIRVVIEEDKEDENSIIKADNSKSELISKSNSKTN